jgi:hypothetical protein
MDKGEGNSIVGLSLTTLHWGLRPQVANGQPKMAPTLAGLELYFKKPKVTKKEENKSTSPATTLPQLLKGFKADKPVWIGGVKKSELGGVFDSGACRRYGIGQELAKAERAVYVESHQKKTGKLIQTMLQQEFDSLGANQDQRQSRTTLPSIGKGWCASSFISENKENGGRLRNGPGYFRVEASKDFEGRLIRLRGPRLHAIIDFPH